MLSSPWPTQDIEKQISRDARWSVFSENTLAATKKTAGGLQHVVCVPYFKILIELSDYIIRVIVISSEKIVPSLELHLYRANSVVHCLI